jgi:hypothetical protein
VGLDSQDDLNKASNTLGSAKQPSNQMLVDDKPSPPVKIPILASPDKGDESLK